MTGRLAPGSLPGHPRHGVRPARPAERSAHAVEKFAALGQMTGGIAHDIRNILCVIASGLRMAERNAGHPAQHRAALAAAEDGVARGLRIVDRLLAFPGLGEQAAGAQDVNALLRKLEPFLKYGAGPGNRILFDLTPGLPSCPVDPAQFNAAVLNLVVNARDALVHGGTISIHTSATQRQMPAGGQRDCVQLSIGDNGIGMPSRVLARIFDRYFTTKGEDGTGLGLPQVQAFMAKIGGDLDVASAPGAGTTFDLFFPIQPDPTPVAPEIWRQLDRWADEGGAIGRSAIA
jgi:signal transduction histidine kinase